MCLTHTVNINGEDKVIPGSEMTYELLLNYAGKSGMPSATYYWRRKGTDEYRLGTLYPKCKPITVEDGMNFTVVHTGNA